MQLPQVINIDKADANDEEWLHIQKLLADALKNFNVFGQREGKILEKDLRERVQMVLTLLTNIEPFETERMQNVRTRLSASLKAMEGSIEVDKNRFEQELIYYLEKLEYILKRKCASVHTAIIF